MSTMNRNSIDSVLRSLRRVNLQGSFLGQTVAVRFGLSESDIETLEQLIDMGATTAGRLAEITGLTSGAVTRVIDRLEQAGYVRRIPDPADRRRVIVEVVPEKVASIQTALDRVSSASAREIGRYTDAQLSLIADFLTKMEQITRAEATALREAPEGEGESEHAAPIGGIDRARLLFKGGVNEALITSGPVGDDLYRARFQGPVPQVRLRDGVVTVQYKRRWSWGARDVRADLTLNPRVAWDLEIAGGANKVQGKLADLDLRSVEVTGGVNQLRLSLGRPSGDVPIRLPSGNNIRIERPRGVAVRLDINGGAANAEFDGMKLGPLGGHPTLESSGAGTASDRFSVEVSGGVARITVAEAG
jgi:DNA-binding MarR family transcriptional regulator